MAKKKNKPIIRPWCWYCEREFEDEKVLMQHQKAKHFKCNMCPRRLNTAGGLAVHIQQVHKLEPENLPRIENALPGRDGYEVEIFGMVGIPAPDVADYKRRKEIELGLSAGSISQPPQKRPKVENRPLSEEELKAQLEAHKALMGVATGPDSSPMDSNSATVYGAPPQAYAAPMAPNSISPLVVSPPAIPPPPPGIFGGPSPPPPFLPGQAPPPFATPFPPAFSPGPPQGLLPPGLPHSGLPPFPSATGVSPANTLPPPSFVPAASTFNVASHLSGRSASPSSISLGQQQAKLEKNSQLIQTTQHEAEGPHYGTKLPSSQLVLPDPKFAQVNPPFKKKTSLKYGDANFAQEEHRAIHPRYLCGKPGTEVGPTEESKGKKRKKAEDFL